MFKLLESYNGGRRDFLRRLLATPPETSQIVREGNVSTVTRFEEKYSIAVGNHGFDSKIILPKSIDGLCLEGSVNYLNDLSNPVNDIAANQKQALKFALENKIPIIAGDCSVNALLLVFTEFNFAPEFLLELSLVKTANKLPAHFNRRKFLQLLTLGLAGYSLALPGTALINLFAITAEKGAQIVPISKTVINNSPHHSLISITFRNLVIGQKMHYLESEHGFKHLLAPWGAFHAGLEDVLLMSEKERMRNLAGLLPFLRYFISDPKTIYTIDQFNPEEQGKKRIVPYLNEPKLESLARRYFTDLN